MGNQIGVIEASGETWKSMKKSVSGPFSLVRLKKYIPAYNECNKQMLSFIDGQLKMGTNVMILPVQTYFPIYLWMCWLW